MAVDLLKPVLSNRTRSVNFFNGRLLAGEDLTNEQRTNRVAHALLGQAIGDGVVYGLEVKESSQSSQPQSPVLAVTRGLAVNKNGGSLLLDTDTEVALVRPATGTTASTASSSIFQECKPTQTGAYIAGAGVYLLTMGPASATQGLAEVSGVSTSQAPCNTKYNVQGVQFRLISIDLTQAELNDTNYLRNLVAYKCFGVAQETAFVTDPLNTPLTSYGLLDDLRSQQVLTNCEVPLAVLYWTATSGLVFVDMWAVRRQVFSRSATEMWAPLANRRRMAEGLAMFLQFQEHIESLRTQAGDLGSVTAQSSFTLLPPVGLIPVNLESDGTDAQATRFFKNMTYRSPVFINGARLEALLRASLTRPPVETQGGEMVWLYRVRENSMAIDFSAPLSRPPAYVVFSSGHLPYQANAHFDLAYWNYSNYAVDR